MRKFGVVLLWAVGIYLVLRAIAEPFVIDMNDPATYQHDWGGPSLAGVLLVHCGMGLVAAALMAWRLMRRSSVRLRRSRKRMAGPGSPDEPGRPAAGPDYREPGRPAAGPGFPEPGRPAAGSVGVGARLPR